RFSLPMLPDASVYFAPLVFVLSAVAISYASLVALVQDDMKKMVAYSSVAHMGFVTAGMFTFTHQGIEGAVFQMVSHGVLSAALFLIVGVVYDRTHSRLISSYGGLVRTMPRYAVLFMIFMLGSVGLPGTSGFVGEFLVILGTFRVSGVLAFFVALGMVLGAVYMLSLYRRVIFGVPRGGAKLSDIDWREFVVFAPLAFLAILLGLWPGVLLEVTGGSVVELLLVMGVG
ncbi:MAG: NADH-quinone oxidoreductase subunit M, partial [Alphaproteobacteria bacterium]